jgi:hypothetical protein
MAERIDAAFAANRREPPKAAAGAVLQEHSLDGILRAEREYLVQVGLHEALTQHVPMFAR